MKPWQRDYHCHTGHFLCAKPEMVAANVIDLVKQEGTCVLGLTEHVYPREAADRNDWDFPRAFGRIREDFLPADCDDLRIIVGAEACILGPDGKLAGQDDGLLDELEPAYVLGGALHSWFAWVENDFKGDWEKFLDVQHKSMIGALCNSRCDAIAHPWCMPLSVYEMFDLPPLDDFSKIPEKMIVELARASGEMDKGLEMNADLINPTHFSNVPKGYDDYLASFRDFVYCLLENGAKVFFGSDSHKLISLSGPQRLYNDLGISFDDSSLWQPKV